jgi:Na+/glutamate symporter
MSATGRGPCDGEALKQLWEEYKYRHDLCWKIILQVTLGSVALAALPYVEMRVVETLRYGILGVPFLAIAFVGFGLGVLLNELDELDLVKTRYREERKACLDVPIAGRSHFRLLAKAYFFALLSLGIANLVTIGLFWIPPAWP